MSTAAGVAAVTAVIRNLLIDGLIDDDTTSTLGNIGVTAGAPDREIPTVFDSRLNLFLYLLTPNQGWRNVGLPSRDARGDLVSAPPLALDLHYLVTAYASRDFHAEILLGYAMQLLHEMPVLTRPAIRNAFSTDSIIDDSGIPTGLEDLAASGIADQIEQIKICQTFLSTEEMFKLWMAFQAPYRPTVAYDVSVVLIESERQGKSAPPVRARTITAFSLLRPQISALLSRAGTTPDAAFVAGRPILTGDRLRLAGRQLGGEGAGLLLDDDPNKAESLEIGQTMVDFNLPIDLLAGSHTLRVIRQTEIGRRPYERPPDDPTLLHPRADAEGMVIAALEDLNYLPTNRTVAESNGMAFLLTPTVVSTAKTLQPVVNATDEFEGTMTVTLSPAVGRTQRASLQLDERDPPPPTMRPAHAYRFAAALPTDPGDPVADVVFAVDAVAKGRYIARVRIDDAITPLEVGSDGRYDGPEVVVP